MELSQKNGRDPNANGVDKNRTAVTERRRRRSTPFEDLHGRNQKPTSYFDTLLHLFKGNIGSGAFGMADAIKNSGIVVGGILTLVIAIVCVHMQHILIKAADYQKLINNLDARPDYAYTLELSFMKSKSKTIRRLSPFMRKFCNFIICLTQLGFCSAYFVFVSSSVKHVLDFHGYIINIHLLILYAFIPIWLTALVRQLKVMVIFSAMANFCMIIGIILTVVFASQDLPPIYERKTFASFETLPFFFGIALFAFEGIALVLPLKNAMKNPDQFGGIFGVLNVGMFFVTICYFFLGELGYWKYGEEAEGSITLNLPNESIFAQIVILMIACGVLLGYALALFIAVQIMFDSICDTWSFAIKYPVASELLFRTLLVTATFIVAEVVPNLTLLLSFVGSVLCSFIMFIFPVMIELVNLHSCGEGTVLNWIKNVIILIFSITGCVAGAYVSLTAIVNQWIKF